MSSSFGLCKFTKYVNEPTSTSTRTIDQQRGDESCKCPISTHKSAVMFTPKGSDGVVSCLSRPNLAKATMTTDCNIATIPINAIIDRIEFFGYDNFNTKDEFSIGLGLLNQGMSLQLIESSYPEVANERVGGCREFIAVRQDGRNDKTIVVFPSCVNVSFTQPVTSGGLMIVVYYHVKPQP